MTAPDPGSEILVVGRDVDGRWTVRESAGLLLGRFASIDAARRFALREQRSRPDLSIALSAGPDPRCRLEGRLTLSSRPRVGEPADD